VTPELSYEIAKNLPQVLRIRLLRNSCYQYLTNYRKPIGLIQQVHWFFKSYRSSCRTGDYRLYIFRNQGRRPVGYGALQLRGDRLYVTECLDTDQRNQNYGREILSVLVEIGKQEKRVIAAEIWATNERSVALHTNAGFELVSQRICRGENLLVFELKP